MNAFSLADLCDLADVTPRTVRYYIAQGLLRPPSGAGPGARYDDGHLHRLRLIRTLQREHLPLAEIRARLDALTDAEVERLVTQAPPVTDSAADYVARVLGGAGARPAARTRTVAPAVTPALFQLPPSIQVEDAFAIRAPDLPQDAAVDRETVRSQWERIAIDTDVELHVRRPQTRQQNRRVDRLLEAAREIFKEVER